VPSPRRIQAVGATVTAGLPQPPIPGLKAGHNKLLPATLANSRETSR